MPYHYREANMEWLTTTKSNLSPAAGSTRAHSARRLDAMAAIVDDNCQASRKLLESLNRHIRVDIYGRCASHRRGRGRGRRECLGQARTKQRDECLRYIANAYKFYLVIEPRVCRGYVSDKFFEILPYPIVPVVIRTFGHEAYVPASAFVDASRFAADLAALAAHLLQLAANSSAYHAYFEWKQRVVFRSRAHHRLAAKNDQQKQLDWISPIESILCDLCVAAHLAAFTNLDVTVGRLPKPGQQQQQRHGLYNDCFRIRPFEMLNFRFDLPMS